MKPVAVLFEHGSQIASSGQLAKIERKTRMSRRSRLSCLAWGHYPDNRAFATARSCARRCQCGASHLLEDGSVTRIRHNVPCFVHHHTYVSAAARDGHDEYVCIRCGHPLLFRVTSDPYATEPVFRKKARYLCNLFGHRVHQVVEREDLVEYACNCGHNFLKQRRALTKVTHRLICLLAGHFVRFVTHREGYAEFVCLHCGHPFCFGDTTIH